MDRSRVYHGLSLVVGTLIAFTVGLVGPSLAEGLARDLPSSLQARGVYAFAALLVIGVVAGAFGRGLVALLACWAGLLIASLEPRHLLPAGLDGIAALAVTLVVAAVGFALARAVDPFWGSEPREPAVPTTRPPGPGSGNSPGPTTPPAASGAVNDPSGGTLGPWTPAGRSAANARRAEHADAGEQPEPSSPFRPR